MNIRTDLDSPHSSCSSDTSPNAQLNTFSDTASMSNGFTTIDLSEPTTTRSSHASSPVNSAPVAQPYRPGIRSTNMSSFPKSRNHSSALHSNPNIPMLDFSRGEAPSPPVSHSWRRIDRWVERNFLELYDNLCTGCTHNDINELEHLLDCTLPLDVRQSLMVHDGQERGGRPCGLLFGCMLLDCEEIVDEWADWHRVGTDILQSIQASTPPTAPTKTFAGPSSSTTQPTLPQHQKYQQFFPASSNTTKSNLNMSPHASNAWRAGLISRQSSLPPNAVQPLFSSPYWIPLARDWGGNCIAVDLNPGPTGRYGQIIVFGRDFDTKIVVARSWGAFLASFADDLESGKAEVVGEDDYGLFGRGAVGSVDEACHGLLRLRECGVSSSNSPSSSTGSTGTFSSGSSACSSSSSSVSSTSLAATAKAPPTTGLPEDATFPEILRWRAEQRWGPVPRWDTIASPNSVIGGDGSVINGARLSTNGCGGGGFDESRSQPLSPINHDVSPVYVNNTPGASERSFPERRSIVSKALPKTDTLDKRGSRKGSLLAITPDISAKQRQTVDVEEKVNGCDDGDSKEKVKPDVMETVESGAKDAATPANSCGHDEKRLEDISNDNRSRNMNSVIY